MKKVILDFFNAVFAGIMIAIGGTVFLSVENRVTGALMFAIGLIVILHLGFNLYTGKIGYCVNNKPSYLLFCLNVWLGNFAGTALVGYGLRITRLHTLSERAAGLCAVKLADDPLSIFLLAIFCGILMYIAVDGYKNIEHVLGKYLTVFLCVSVFILCGFEHCIANMYYFSVSATWGIQALLYLLVMSLGNAIGGMMIPALNKIKQLLLKKA